MLGALVLAAYLVALALTVGLRSEHVRPLYDGFTTPAPYRWVDPPPFFAAGNVEPTAVSTTVELGRDGSVASGVATPDGQFVMNLGRGAIAPSPGAHRVRVRITPVAPSTLAPVPAPLRSNGNAYRVDMTYEPTGVKVRRLARAGTLVFEIPELGDDLFTSDDGTRWTALESRALPPRQLSLAATIAEPGDFVAATNLPELVGPAGTSSGSSAVVIGIVTAVLAAILLVGAYLLVRRRRRRAAPGEPPVNVP